MLSHFCDKLPFLTASSFVLRSDQAHFPFDTGHGFHESKQKRRAWAVPVFPEMGLFHRPLRGPSRLPFGSSLVLAGVAFPLPQTVFHCRIIPWSLPKSKVTFTKNSLLFSPKRCKFRLWGSWRELVKLRPEPPCDVRQDRPRNHRASVDCALIAYESQNDDANKTFVQSRGGSP